jgi:hypothetical protein
MSSIGEELVAVWVMGWKHCGVTVTVSVAVSVSADEQRRYCACGAR